jgi:SAM-dependent methyltransferase
VGRAEGRGDTTGLGEYLVSSRSFAEYEAVFGLSAADLAGRVLDCPGGGSSATAGLRARGADAVAVDPAYAVPLDELAARLAGELARGEAWTRSRADAYVWDWFGDVDVHTRSRRESARLFVADRRAHPERYVAAALPSLPFDDGAFDLVLSSHLLFTYADRLDRAAHLAALREMARVCRGEVRVYPLLDSTGARLDGLVDALVGDLAAVGLRADLRPTRYEFQRGARQLLVVRR